MARAFKKFTVLALLLCFSCSLSNALDSDPATALEPKPFPAADQDGGYGLDVNGEEPFWGRIPPLLPPWYIPDPWVPPFHRPLIPHPYPFPGFPRPKYPLLPMPSPGFPWPPKQRPFPHPPTPAGGKSPPPSKGVHGGAEGNKAAPAPAPAA